MLPQTFGSKNFWKYYITDRLDFYRILPNNCRSFCFSSFCGLAFFQNEVDMFDNVDWFVQIVQYNDIYTGWQPDRHFNFEILNDLKLEINDLRVTNFRLVFIKE